MLSTLFRRQLSRQSPAQLTRLIQTSTPAEKVLVTGAGGQIGCELVPFLRQRYGHENVIASDIVQSRNADEFFCQADVQDHDGLTKIVEDHKITTIIHLASLLSAIGEKKPFLALKVNTRGIENVLEIARESGTRVFAPSSIAIYGPTTPKDNTPQETIARPTTVYGITKVYTEHIGEYYHSKYGVDFRSLRYPGIISSEAMAGGGTTDYAVEIFHEALAHQAYTCFLRDDTEMPMMYMPDTLRATVQLLDAPRERLSHSSYNITGMSFTPKQLAEAIKRKIPEFKIDYSPDFRQAIADTWPRSIDDSAAANDWDWKPEFDLDAMTAHMLNRLEEKATEKHAH